MNKQIIILCTLLLMCSCAFGQKQRKVTFVGGARSVMSNSKLDVTDTSNIADTSTAKRNTGGYALIDLGVNIKPNQNTEILGMFRIRNAFGGFWGAGVTFDVRQLYIKGVVANTVRYQLGDLNLKQTQFTLYNHHADAIDSLPEIFNLQRNIVNYEKFYMNNTWRMQGANVDFGLTFKEYIKEVNFTGFLTRLNATNFSSIPERLMAGGSIDLIQSKKLKVGYNINSIFDVLGTIADSNTFTNRVQSIDAQYIQKIGGQSLKFSAEIGNSKYSYSLDTLAPVLKDYFVHANAAFNIPKYNVTATLGYLNVAPEYRSIGAQSKDVNYSALPLYYERFTNSQSLRPLGLLDVVANDNIYNRTLSSRLMPANNLYNNAMPFGLATFNRVGMYLSADYKKDIQASVSYYNLSEIKGQGTFSLRKFSVLKGNVMVPVNKYIKLKNKVDLDFGARLENVNRTGTNAVENVDFANTHFTAGFRFELFENFDLLGGLVIQNTKGNDFIADRDVYTEVVYFNQNQYNMQQQLRGIGVRYNFSPKIYLTGMYQQAVFNDKLKQQASYSINQFNLIYNMLF